MGDRLSAEELDEAALSGAVGALQDDPVPGFDGEGDVFADRDFAVLDGDLLQKSQPFGMVGCLENLQRIAAFDVFQQFGFFFDG